MQGSYFNNNSYNNMKQYVVKSGDSLYMIAKAHNTTVEDLKSVNHLYSNTIYPNQILFIPNTVNNTNCNGNTYITNNGESLKDILVKFNLNLNDITNYNDIDKLKLEGNQMLLIEKRVYHKKYQVKEGDKIEDILSKYNLSPLEFLKINEYKLLMPGTEIIVERWLSFFGTIKNIKTGYLYRTRMEYNNGNIWEALYMKNKLLFKIILIALFAALAFVGTCIHIPLPTGGMIHLGNFVVIISALLCGGLVGGLAGGIGCGLYDLFIYSSVDGFFKYLILKFIMGLVVGYGFRIFYRKRDSFKAPLFLSILGALVIIFTTLVIILFNVDMITIKYDNPTGYIILVSIIAYIVGILLIIAAVFSIKLKQVHRIALVAIAISVVVNLVLEFITKILLSMLIDSLEFKAALVKGFSTMPSVILTGTLSIILGTLIFMPLYKATRRINYFDDLNIEEENEELTEL